MNRANTSKLLGSLTAPLNIDRCMKRLAIRDPGKSYRLQAPDGSEYVYEYVVGDRTFYIETIRTETTASVDRVPCSDPYEIFEDGQTKFADLAPIRNILRNE